MLKPALRRLVAAATPCVNATDALPVPAGRGRQGDAAPATPPPPSQVVGAVMGLTVRAMNETLKYWNGVLGMEMPAATKWEKDQAVLDLMGLPKGAEYRVSSGVISGSPARIEFTEVKGVARKPFDLREVVARIKSVLRRGGADSPAAAPAAAKPGAAPEEIRFGRFRLELSSRRLFAEIEHEHGAERQLESDRRRLEAERQAQATHLRVERAARETLSMRAATPANTTYVVDSGLSAASATAADAMARGGEAR